MTRSFQPQGHPMGTCIDNSLWRNQHLTPHSTYKVHLLPTKNILSYPFRHNKLYRAELPIFQSISTFFWWMLEFLELNLNLPRSCRWSSDTHKRAWRFSLCLVNHLPCKARIRKKWARSKLGKFASRYHHIARKSCISSFLSLSLGLTTAGDGEVSALKSVPQTR